MKADSYESVSDSIVRVKVDGIELYCGPITPGHDLFEHIANQPGPKGWDLQGIETIVGYSFSPRPGQRLELVDNREVLVSAPVPEIDESQECYWPLPQHNRGDAN